MARFMRPTFGVLPLWLLSFHSSVVGVRVDDDAEDSGEEGKVQVSGKYSTHGSSKYKAAQAVGFSIYTWPEKDEYIGNEDVGEDLNKRMKVMERAVQTAGDSSEIDTSDSTLKVFIAPEFFFRGIHGAYNVSLVGESRPFHGLLDRLSALVADDKWKNWLFVFGTVVVGADSNKNGDADLFMNFAPVIKGNGGKKLLAFKERLSGIDFIKGQGLMSVKGYGDIPQHAIETLKSKGYTVVDNNVFYVDDIRFGIEICLDHGSRELDTSLKSANLSPNGVQLQLITAAGMNIQYSDVPSGGPVFLQDGGSSLKGDGPPLSSVFPSWNFVKTGKKKPATLSALGDDWEDLLKGYFDVGKYKEWDTSPTLNIYSPMTIGDLKPYPTWEVGQKSTEAKAGSTISVAR